LGGVTTRFDFYSKWWYYVCERKGKLKKIEIIKVIATVILAIVASIIMVIMIFDSKEVQADDVVTMATLNKAKEDIQTKMDDLNAIIVELKAENIELKKDISELKKADATLKDNQDEFKSDLKSINNKISNIQTRERYFYTKASTTDYHYYNIIAKYIIANLY